MKRIRIIVSAFLMLAMLTSFCPMGSFSFITSAMYANGTFNDAEYSSDPAQYIVNIAKAQLKRSGSSLGYSVEWCACFISDCAQIAGQSYAIPPSSFVSTLCNNIVETGGGKLISSISESKTGDVVLIDWNGGGWGHVELVTKSYNGELYTIGGNTGSGGTLSTRIVNEHKPLKSYSAIKIYRPNYSVTPTPCTTHTKGEYQFYEAVHPHCKCYKCSVCGEVFRTDETVFLSTCATCVQSVPVAVEDGVYVFHCVRNMDKVLDIQYDSTEVGANIQLYDNLYNQEQKFRVVNMGDYYCIQSIYSGMWLDISSPYNEPGSNIQLWNTNTSTEQKWVFEDAGDGNVYIHSLYGMYLDTGGSTDNTTNIQTWDFDGTTSQQWKLEKVSPGKRVNVEEGVYVFQCVRNPSRVMDIQSNSSESGANIQLYDNWYNQVQKFRVVNKGTYYCIQSVYSGMWLDVSHPVEGKAGCNIQLWNENTNKEEKWIFEDAGDGNVYVRNYYEVYLDTGGLTDNNTSLQTWYYDGSTSQQWKLVKTSPYPRIEFDNGVYTIHSASDPDNVFHIQNASLNNNANIQLYDDLNNNIQQFRITKHKDDNTDNYYYTVQSVYSGYWLDITYPCNTSDCNIKLYNTDKSTEEKWVFENAGNGKVLIRSLYDVYVGTEGDRTDSGTNIKTVDYRDTLAMQWTLHKVFTVTYDANDGADAPAAQAKQESITLTLSADKPIRTGFTFTGWNTIANGKGTAYPAGGTYTADSNLTLYAQWTRSAYVVTLDANGGVCGIPAITGYYDDPYGVLPVPTRNGFNFVGWFTADGAEVTESTTVTTTDDHTLFARWEVIGIAAKPDSTAVIDEERGFIYGLDFELTAESLTTSYLDVIGNRRLEFSTPVICTGTVVSVINDSTGEAETTFEIVIFGDVDCDGIFTPNDVTQLRFMNANMTERFADGSAQALASDVDHDGIFAAPNDYTVLRYAKAGLREISQVV